MSVTQVAGPYIKDNAIDGANVSLASEAAGDIMYYNGTDWVRLAKGTADQVLTMNDGATAPQWETAASASAFPYSSATVASIEATTSTHNDRIPAMYVTANDSGDMVDGFGPQIIFRATDSGASNSILGQMSFERNGADNSGKFRIQSYRAGAANTLMIIDKDGEMQGRENNSYPSITKGIAKAWGQINAANGALASPDYNITSTGRDSAGVYTVTIDVDMESTPYVVWATMREPVAYMATVSNFAVGSYKVRGYNTSGTAIDIDISTGIFGEQT